MAIIASTDSTTSYQPISEGVHVANCIWVVDLGTQKIVWQGQEKEQRKVMLTWEIPEETFEIDGEEKPRIISKEYTLSLSDKANLRAHLESWRGKRFTEEELSGFDLANILGVSCQLQVLHTHKGDKTYANIGAIMSMPKGTKPSELFHEKIYFDLSDESSLNFMDNIPEWIRDKIKLSPEYKALVGSQIDDSDNDFTEIEDDGDLPF